MVSLSCVLVFFVLLLVCIGLGDCHWFCFYAFVCTWEVLFIGVKLFNFSLATFIVVFVFICEPNF